MALRWAGLRGTLREAHGGATLAGHRTIEYRAAEPTHRLAATEWVLLCAEASITRRSRACGELLRPEHSVVFGTINERTGYRLATHPRRLGKGWGGGEQSCTAVPHGYGGIPCVISGKHGGVFQR